MIYIKETIKKMNEYKPPLENRRNNLNFDFNENTTGPSPKVIKALKNSTGVFLSSYPEYNKLIKKIADYCKVNSNKVIATNGSGEAISLVINSTIKENNEIIIISPTFQLFKFYAQIAGGKITELNYEKDFRFPIEKIMKTIGKNTKLVILCNPNNPTGSIISKKSIEKILKKTSKGMVLVDEAYYEFSKQTAVSLLKKYDNLLITRSFSKAFGLAGLRIGYLIGNEKIIKMLNKTKSPYNVNSLAAKCAIVALDDLNYAKKYVQEVNKSKKMLCKFLKNRKIEFYNGKANFVLVNFGKQKNYVFEQLKKRKILVRDVSKQPLLEGFLRISPGTIKQTKYFLKELEKILSKPVIIFDFDGVIIKVDNSYRKAIKKTVKYFTGKSPSNKEIQEQKNTGKFNNDWALTEKLIKKKEVSIKTEKVIKKFQEYYLGKNFNGLIKNEKLLIKKEIIKNLAEKNRLAILTGRPKKEAEFAIKKNKITDYFTEVITLDELKEKLKPNPFGINLILKELKTKKACYIGDSVEDIIAAKKADIKSIGFVKKNRKGLMKAMKENKADFILKDIKDIVKVIK